MMEANSCRPMPNSLGVLTLLIYDANFTLQSSRKSERNGKQRRRRKRLHAKPTKSDTAPTCNSALTKEALLKRLSMDRCDRRSASLANLLNIPNFLPSGTNLQPLATALLLSTARRVQVSPRAWLSMPPPTAMRTTVQIVTTAVTPSRPTDKTRKCTSRTTRNVLPVQKPTPSMTCLKTIKMVKIQVYQKRTRLLRRIEQASLDDSPYGGSLPICCEPMQQFQHLSYGAVLAFPFGGGCMFLIGCVHNGGYFSTDTWSENCLTVDVGSCYNVSRDTTKVRVRIAVRTYVMQVASSVFLSSFITSRGIPKSRRQTCSHWGLERLHAKRRLRQETIYLLLFI